MIDDVKRDPLGAIWPAIVGFSWHRPQDNAQYFNNAPNNIAFADGHTAMTDIYWGGGWSFTYNPPSDYNYLWDPFSP